MVPQLLLPLEGDTKQTSGNAAIGDAEQPVHSAPSPTCSLSDRSVGTVPELGGPPEAGDLCSLLRRGTIL